MRLPKLGIATVIALLTVVADTSISFYSLTSLPVPKVLAQTNSEQEAEVEQFFQQGIQHYQKSQYREALQSWQQALAIARKIGDRQGEGNILRNISIAYDSLGDYRKAIEYQQQSLAVAREIGDRLGEARSLGNLGNAYGSLGDHHKAIEYHQKSLAIFREIGDRRSEGNALGNLSIAYYYLGDYQKALDSSQQHLAIARELQDPKMEQSAQQVISKVQQQNNPRIAEADRHLQQGSQQHQKNQFREALQSFQQALAIYREIRDRKREVAAIVGLALAYYSLGDYQKALDFSQQSLVIARELQDPKMEQFAQQILSKMQQRNNPRTVEADRLLRQGYQQDQKSQFREALQSSQQALAIYREIGDRDGEKRSLANLGIAYRNLGDYRKAIDYQQQSLAIAREIGDREGEGAALLSLGVAYYSLIDYHKAIDYLQQSLEIAKEIGNRQLEGKSLGNLSNVYRSLGDYRKAIDYSQQSLSIARKIGDRKDEGAALSNLGAAYSSVGDYRQAIEYHRQSLAIAREIDNRQGEGIALGDLGLSYNSLGEYSKTIEYHQQSLIIAREIGDREGEGLALGNLGLAYFHLGDYPKAIEYYKQDLAIARKIGNRQAEGTVLGNLGVAYNSLGDSHQAIEYHQQALTIARSIGDLKGEAVALNNLGNAVYSSGHLAQAEKILFQGIEVWESLREKLGNDDANKVSIFEEQARTYRTLQKVLIAQNKTTTALEISERGRGRAFIELLTRRLSANPKEIIPAASLNPTIAQIKQIAQKQNATLVQYSIVGDEFKIQGRVQGKESELYIWVIKPTGEVNFRKVDLKPLWQQQNTSLAELVTNTRDSIGVRSRATAIIALKPGVNEKQRLQKLHEILIKPIADLLPTDANNHVIFVPQRELFLVPFVALQDEIGKHLIEKHTILTAPSIQVLELTHAKKAEMQQSRGAGEKSFQNLIVGNPTMPSLTLKIGEPPEKLPSLPGAQQEAIEIGKLFNTQPLIGSQAKEATIKSQISQANIIHFATHGLLDYGELQGKYRAGVPGALAFTPDEKEDGLLTSDEILDLKLKASLVVLSACDTGRGKLTGDGVVGLSRAFITAGTPSIVVSLWAVPDAPTSDLMKEFYQQMRTNPNKAQALRQAMLTIMKTRPHPKDWAAFTFIGEAY
ncbi:tetratricopeptide repeat protein [Floridanema evergladense]|uniref:Tetratricopeptide repeat protein n=1 Tax=Floridaenema evergladense BLCC-F167 TaxID=3153639 RepID=A0ABV4WUS5_9CYAN